MTPEVQELLVSIQAEILAHGPGPNYAAAYKKEETYYWECIPDWIISLPKGGRALDIGSAYGTLAIFTKRQLAAEIICVDVITGYPPMALLAREGIEFALRNVELDPLDDLGTFNLIIFTEVLEHLNFHPRNTLKKLRSLLRPEGKMVLSTPDAREWGRVTLHYQSLEDMPDPMSGRPWIDGHVWQFSEEELRGVLEAAGFTIDEFEYSRGGSGRHFNVLCGIASR
jgi:SAM-dependent methyltransferase